MDDGNASEERVRRVLRRVPQAGMDYTAERKVSESGQSRTSS